MDEIKEMGTSRGSGIQCLTIVGQIEGHQLQPDDVKTTKYEHVLPLIAAIEETPEIEALLILLNTMGGDVEAGLAIAEMISGMKKPTVSRTRRGTLDRRPARRCGEAEHDRPLRRNDHTPRAPERRRDRRTADL